MNSTSNGSNIDSSSHARPDGVASNIPYRLSDTRQGSHVGTPQVSNEEFLEAVFHTLPAGAQAVVCTKSGDPQVGGWFPRSTAEGVDGLSSANNNYFVCSSINPDGMGGLRARKEQVAAFHCLMLDDVGTKIPLDRFVDFEPSWCLETSPGNHQLGIILDKPLTDLPEAERLQQAVMDAGLCDTGAGGLARWARLPCGVNGKAKYRDEASGRAFECRLVDWKPHRRYSTDALARGLRLQLKPAAPGLPTTRPSARNTSDPAAEDAVVARLKAKGLYKRQLEVGKHDVTCPWVAEHTDRVDNGAAYFEPSESHPAGGFCCQHSHRDECRLTQLLDFLGIRRDPNHAVPLPGGMTALIANVKAGDVGAPLEPDNVSILARLSRADYQRARANLKAANPRVSLPAVDDAVKAASTKAEAAPTHHAYAVDVLDGLTFDGFRPVAHAGFLHVVEKGGNIWVRKDRGLLSRLVAEAHDGKRNCTRQNDYTGIAQHVMSLVGDDAFFDAAPVGLACTDGFYRLVGNEIKVEPLSPSHRQRVLLDYSPREMATPHFDAFLHETFESATPGEEAQQIALVQEIAGAIMLGLMPGYQKAVLFYDPYGRAGKGTLERIIRALVPSAFVTAVSPFDWNQEYYVVTLAGARLNVVGELPENESIPAASFKSVTGGDLITGRHPTHAPISFKNEAAHLFMSNHLINSRDQSEAFFSRWLIVEFPNSRLRSGLPLDPNTAQRIVDNEMPGVAHWAMLGAKRLLQNGGFTSSSAHERLMLKWRRGNSSLEEFIHDGCNLCPGARVRRSKFYAAYKVWCTDNGRKPFAKGRVKELLEHNVGLGVSLGSDGGIEVFRGVALTPHETPDFDGDLNEID